MKLLIDQDLSAGAAEILRSNGLDVVHAREVGLAVASDESILEWCRGEDRIVVTADADFHAHLALSGAVWPSVIRVRIEGLRDRALAELITRVIHIVGDDLARGSVVSVTPTAIRLRTLPLLRDE